MDVDLRAGALQGVTGLLYALFLFFIIGFSIFVPQRLAAETVVWSTTEPDTVVCSTKGDGFRYCDFFMYAPTYSIQYHASVYKIDTTGSKQEKIACGSTVQPGTRLSFEFEPHTYDDAYWFASGGYMDSPYGEWRANAAAPTPIACVDKDYLGTFNWPNSSPAAVYMPLVIDPPQKNIQGTDALGSCVQENGNTICTTTAGADANVTFNFAGTYGKFYQRMYAVASQSKAMCYAHDESHNDPMVGLTAAGRQLLSSSGNAAQFTSHATGNLGTYVSAYKLNVPSQTISCPIHVAASKTYQNPNDPTTPTDGPRVTLTVGNTAACRVGFPQNISLAGRSTTNRPVRFLVDWNNDSVVDQIVPGEGAVASGSSVVVQRTFAAAGPKSVRIIAEDDQGNTSDPFVLQFACTTEQDKNAFINDTTTQDGGNAPAIMIRASPSLTAPGRPVRVIWSSANVTDCSVAGTNGDSWPHKRASVVGGELSKPIEYAVDYTLTCTAGTEVLTARARVLPTPTFHELPPR